MFSQTYIFELEVMARGD